MYHSILTFGKKSTIIDDAWTRKQVCNMWLEGPQEQISNEIGISVGTVNNIIQDLISKDNQLVMMREISLSAKKNGVDIPQIAANLRYANAIKRLGLDGDKLEVCLSALGSIFSENEVTPEIFSSLFYELCTILLKEQKSFHQVADEVKSRIEKLHELDVKVQEKKKMLEDAEVSFKRTMESNNMSIEKMEQIMDLKAGLELYGIDFDELLDLYGILRNIRARSDPDAIVKKFSKIIFMEEVESELKMEYEQLRLMVEELGKYAANRKQAIKILTRLCHRGISEQDIWNVLDIIEQHIEHMTILQLTEHIDTYGNISTAKFRLLMEQIQLESENQMLKSSNHAIRVKERSYLP